MLSMVARGAYMLFVATMVVAWAMSAGNSKPAEPKHEQVTEYWYC